ncbi:PREDICTED: probable arabinosyltransferase ARAD1 [Tarenaya hassleriana]|uniref:probable arabinosyltransferase ARAD1 n=1 Tax=Tarenaya hassleriana TaxID=28532 RepID=UPI00053C2C63|nr:PREDICTED: probable arabinosyltransferase ARAD1 [Tarenaya hassleriana]
MVGKLLLCLFLVTSIIFVLSWSFVLHSTGQIHFLDYPLLHNPIFPAMNDVNSGVSTRGNDEHYNDEVKGEKDGNSVGQEIGKCMCEVPGEEPLKVYMYDMDPEFHFGLLDWKPEGNSSKSVWPDIRKHIPPYPGGLNLQHSIEYWLTLDLLASEFPDIPRANAAKRVHNSSEADVIFVPFFSSLSYNRFSNVSPHRKTSRNKELQEKLVKFLTVQDEWKRSGGRDHVVLAHHPNSMLDARNKLFPAMFILSDFGRYPPTIANLDKDIIAPYKHVVKSYETDVSDFDTRKILLYFQGAIYRKDGGFIRQELFYRLQNENDVTFSFGSVKNDGINKATKGMHNSKFCLNIAGDTPSSNRLFDAIASHCVPVIISDDIELPFEDVLDYSEFSIFIRTSDALKEGFLINFIRGIRKDEWTRMWKRLKEVDKFYEFNFPSKEGNAVQMIWQAVARKVPTVKTSVHKSRRYYQTGLEPQRELSSLPIPRSFW